MYCGCKSICGVLVLVIFLAVPRLGSAQMQCYSTNDCGGAAVNTSIEYCCRGTLTGLTYARRAGETCTRCFVYGWVWVNDDGDTLPQGTITVDEGSTVTLTIGYLKGGAFAPRPRSFQITTSGSEGSSDYQLVSSATQLLLVDPITITVQLLNDNETEGEETLTLTLTETNDFGLENEFLFERVDIRIRDINRNAQIQCYSTNDCGGEAVSTSIEDCCRNTLTGLTYAVRAGETCTRCFVYGWVRLNDDADLVPQGTITVDEGSIVTLLIGYHKGRGFTPRPRHFQITANGSAGSSDYYLMSSATQQLLVNPIAITVQLLNDGEAGEREETLTLTLTETNAQDVQNEFLLGTVDIRIRDINMATFQPQSVPTSTGAQMLSTTTFQPRLLPTSTGAQISSISSAQPPLPSTTIQIPILTPPSVPPLEISLRPVVSGSSVEVHVEANKGVKARIILRDGNQRRHKQDFIGTSGTITFTDLPVGRGNVRAVAREDDGGRYDTGWNVFVVN